MSGEELAIIEPEQPTQTLTLFGTADPVAIVDKASVVALALDRVIQKQGLYTVIGSKKHVHVEGWTLLGSMLGVFAHIEWTKKTEDGWEARAVAVAAASGAVVGAGEAECLRGETKWARAEDHALRGMAQTRAISRALRGPLGFVAVLAGYAATPFDEMTPPTSDELFTERETARRAAASAPQTKTASEILADARGKLVKPLTADYDDATAVCPRCGRAEALAPPNNPRFCAMAKGGCGAPKKGDAWAPISHAEWRETHS